MEENWVKVLNLGKQERVSATGDLFIGAVERQSFVTEADSASIRIGVVTFKDGAVNRYHSHTFDQVLLITDGEGIVQVEGQPEQKVTVGDLIFVPAGERHWQGAEPGKNMSHLTGATPQKPQSELARGVS